MWGNSSQTLLKEKLRYNYNLLFTVSYLLSWYSSGNNRVSCIGLIIQSLYQLFLKILINAKYLIHYKDTLKPVLFVFFKIKAKLNILLTPDYLFVLYNIVIINIQLFFSNICFLKNYLKIGTKLQFGHWLPQTLIVWL